MDGNQIDYRAVVAQLRELMGKAPMGEMLAVENSIYSVVPLKGKDRKANMPLSVNQYFAVIQRCNAEYSATRPEREALASLLATTHNALPTLLDRFERLVDVAEAAKEYRHVEKCHKAMMLPGIPLDSTTLDNALNALEDGK